MARKIDADERNPDLEESLRVLESLAAFLLHAAKTEFTCTPDHLRGVATMLSTAADRIRSTSHEF